MSAIWIFLPYRREHLDAHHIVGIKATSDISLEAVGLWGRLGGGGDKPTRQDSINKVFRDLDIRVQDNKALGQGGQER